MDSRLNTLFHHAASAKDEKIRKVIECTASANPFFSVLPFDKIEGNALSYYRENADWSDNVCYSKVVVGLTCILADAGVNPLFLSKIRVQSENLEPLSGAFERSMESQVLLKAKHVGRMFAHMLVRGTGEGGTLDGLSKMCRKKVDTGENGSMLSFSILDDLIDSVTDKGSKVDYFLMPARTIRSYRALSRGMGNQDAPTVDVFRERVVSYRDIPIFRNDYIPIDQVKGESGNTTTIFTGTFDDGSRTKGIAGLCHNHDTAGFSVVDVDDDPPEFKEAMGEDPSLIIKRVKWNAGLALFSENGLACAEGIKD